VALERYPGARSAGVFGGVGQRLGRYVVGGHLDRLGKPFLVVYGYVDRYRGAQRQRPERRRQAALREDRRVDALRDLAHLVGGRV